LTKEGAAVPLAPSLVAPLLEIDPIDPPLHNNAAKKAFLLSIILFNKIVNYINCCAITFPQSIHDISPLVVGAIEM